MIVFARDNGGGFRPLEAAPDGPGQYVMRDMHPRRPTNIARTVGTLTYKGATYNIVEYT